MPTLASVIPSTMLSPINTNVDLSLPLAPAPTSFYRHPSPNIPPYSFQPQIQPQPNPYSTLYPLPIHIGSSPSPLTPTTIVPSEEILNLGAISPLRNSNEGEDGVGSADIIYGSDGEPSTDNFGVVERGGENMVGGIGLTGMETMANTIEPPFYRIQGDNTGGHYNNLPLPPLQPQNLPIPPYFSPPQHSQIPPYLSQQQHQQQFSNPSYQYHPHSNFSPPYPPPFQLPQGLNDFNNNRQPQQNLGMNNIDMNNTFMPYPQQQYQGPNSAYSQYSPISHQSASPQLTFSPQSPYSQFSPPMNQLLPYPHPSAHAMQLHQQHIQALSQQNQSQQQQNQQNQNQQYQSNELYRNNSPLPPHSQASSSQLHQQQQQQFNNHNSNSPYSIPQIYSPPPEGLARGGLAQAKFYEEVYGREGVYSAQSMINGIGANTIKRLGGLGRGLPRPPVHSPHALWVGSKS